MNPAPCRRHAYADGLCVLCGDSCRWHGLAVCSCGNIINGCRCFYNGAPPDTFATLLHPACGAAEGARLPETVR